MWTERLGAARTVRPGDIRLLVGTLIGINLLGAAAMIIDWRISAALLAAVVGVVLASERPVWGLGLLILGRLTSSGSNAWLTVGRVHIDLFEVSLLCVAIALAGRAVKERIWWFDLRFVPWRAPVVGLLLIQLLSFFWCPSRTDWIMEVLSTVMLLVTTLAIVVFAREARTVRRLLVWWVLVSSTVAALATFGLGVASEEAVFEMAQTSREGGFGQHPNWYAMNLMFTPLTATALALSARGRAMRLSLGGLGLFVFVAQMNSGSRGGTASLLIGAGMLALFDPRARRYVLAGLAMGLSAAAGMLMLGLASGAMMRTFNFASVLTRSIRQANWQACGAMAVATYGRGIGAGGYDKLLARIDPELAESQYAYPHGIFWEILAHYGLFGVLLATAFVGYVVQLGMQTIRSSRDPADRTLVAAMLATILGYMAWSFFEFSISDKPFWEYLGLYTALCLAMGRGSSESRR